LTILGLKGRAITVLYSPHQTAIGEVISTMRLEGKVALISGGARGQGATEARLFAREGAKVVIGDLLEEEGKRVEAEINASGGACLFVKLDVTQAEDWQQAVAAAVARFGTLHVLVNNAGIGSTRGPDGEPVTIAMDIEVQGRAIEPQMLGHLRDLGGAIGARGHHHSQDHGRHPHSHPATRRDV
jgi:NAD(P)-dependent dehydrogenase (short-subunit alcohol dehydrogenase family)